jgi:hypothetical protein
MEQIPRIQDPIVLDDDSEPEPDVAVVAGDPRDYLADRVLEVYREPVAEASARYGWSYRSMERIAPGGSVSEAWATPPLPS